MRVVYELETQGSLNSTSLAPQANRTVTKTQSTSQSLPASQDFPELISDSEHDDAEVVGWEVLDDCESNGGGTAGPEAWVVLG
jgi:hypothetical protein